MDTSDLCQKSNELFNSSSLNDHDIDGCLDSNEEDPDDDNDGVNDGDDLYPLDPADWADVDGDGVGDSEDAFPDDASEQSDSDGDGIGDVADAFPDDATPWVSAFKIRNSTRIDADGRRAIFGRRMPLPATPSLFCPIQQGLGFRSVSGLVMQGQ